MPYFGVARHRSCSAAGSVTEHQIELPIEGQFSRVESAEANRIASRPRAEGGLHRLEPAGADVTGGDRGGGVALGQDGSLPSRSGAAIEDGAAVACQLRDQLRSFILNAHQPARARHLSADHPSGARYEDAGLELQAVLT